MAGFGIPKAGFQIPDSRARDLRFHKRKCLRFRHPDYLTWGERSWLLRSFDICIKSRNNFGSVTVKLLGMLLAKDFAKVEVKREIRQGFDLIKGIQKPEIQNSLHSDKLILKGLLEVLKF